ncbi:MAG TPA: hypothetical protein VFG65_06890 [Fimbriimonadales bacterium]|jgi:ABC-type sugar transport system substrate-binding protein|nr:hypothetical protein [Fimbriimonadales bacterium]
MKIAHLLAVALLAGCSGKKVPPAALYGLVLPKSPSFAKTEILLAYRQVAAKLNMHFNVAEYDREDVNSIVKATNSLPISRAPVAIFLTDPEVTKATLYSVAKKRRNVITIGADAAISPRVGHSGDDSRDLAYMWDIRVGQMRHRVRRALIIFGNAPVNQTAITAELYKQSDKWRKYKLRTRRLSDLTEDDLDWADLITPIGEEAVSRCLDVDKRLLPVDGSETSLGLLRSGRVDLIFAPGYFEVGLRAARIAREFAVYGSIPNRDIATPYKEVVKDTIDWYLKYRHSTP